MKKKYKVIALALFCVAILCSFTYSSKEGDVQRGSYAPSKEDMRILHYRGHRYVCYRMAGYHGSGASIIHDPDCKCGKGGAK